MPKPSQNTRSVPPVARRDSPPDTAALLEQYGINAVPSTTYEWGGYRYTNASDAIAAAKRDQSA